MKDKLLKAREQALKNEDKLIAIEKQHIKELSKKRNTIEPNRPTCLQGVTIQQEGDVTPTKDNKISPCQLKTWCSTPT